MIKVWITLLLVLVNVWALSYQLAQMNTKLEEVRDIFTEATVCKE